MSFSYYNEIDGKPARVNGKQWITPEPIESTETLRGNVITIFIGLDFDFGDGIESRWLYLTYIERGGFRHESAWFSTRTEALERHQRIAKRLRIPKRHVAYTELG